MTDKVATTDKDFISDKGGRDRPMKDIPIWVAFIGRIGYTSKAIVYVLIGILSLMLAAGIRSQAAGKDGAIRVISEMQYGDILLIFIGIGLVFYGVWRYVEVVFDPANLGWDTKGSVKKFGYLITGTTYLLLGIQAFGLAFGLVSGNGGGSSGGSSDGFTATLLENPIGRIVVAVIGGAIVSYGCYNLYRACSKNFEKKLELSVMSSGQTKRAFLAGQAGYTAMFVNYSFLGSFLIVSAITTNAKDAGLSRTLMLLLEQPFGPWLLGVFSVGIMFYGIFNGYLARFRPIFVKNSLINKYD